jgi:hypothetical protein
MKKKTARKAPARKAPARKAPARKASSAQTKTGVIVARPADLVSQSYKDGATRTLKQPVSICKANNKEFISFYPYPETFGCMAVLTSPDGTDYIVTKALQPEIPHDCKICYMIPYMTRNHTICIWPLSTRKSRYRDTLLQIVNDTKGSWVRVPTDKNHGYFALKSEGKHPEANWTKEPLERLYSRISQDQVIYSTGHHVLKALRGAV